MQQMLRMMKYYDDAILVEDEHTGVDFSQTHLNEQLRAYLQLKGRDDTKIINELGNCNGWEFLYQIYASLGKQKAYYDLLSVISLWDREQASLTQSDLPPSIKAEYKNKEDLFKHIIHHLVILHYLSQMSEELSLNWGQGSRQEQYQLIRDPKLGRQLTHLCSFEGNFEHHQLVEMLTILSHFPGASVDISLQVEGEPVGHAMSIFVPPEGGLEYYDSNLECRLKRFDTASSLVRHINDNVINPLKIAAYDQNPYFEKDLKTHFRISAFKFYNQHEVIPKVVQCESFKMPQGTSPNGFNPLHFAVFENNADKVKKLAGSHPELITQKNRFGESPIALAFKLKNEPLMLWLLEEAKRKGIHCDLSKEVSILEIPPHHYDEIISVLYVKGIFTAQSTDRNGISLAPWSLIHNENEGMKKIQEMDPNRQDPLGYSLLMMLCMHPFKDFKLFQNYLDSAPIDLNLVTKKGNTALMIATILGSTQTVEELLKKGAKVDIVDDKNKTVFDYAKNKPEIMKLLKKYASPQPMKPSKRTSLVFTQPVQEIPVFTQETTTDKKPSPSKK
jgi:hypothetical protein